MQIWQGSATAQGYYMNLLVISNNDTVCAFCYTFVSVAMLWLMPFLVFILTEHCSGLL